MVEVRMKRGSPLRRAAGAAVLLLLAGCSVLAPRRRNLPACSAPRVDAAGWVRQPGPYRGFSFLLPPAFREDTTVRFMHGGRKWQDGPREFSAASGYWSPASFRGNYADEPPSDPEYSECWDTIAGLRVFMATRYRDGRYAANAWFPDPHASGGFRGFEVVLGGEGVSSRDQELALAIIRTVAPDPAP